MSGTYRSHRLCPDELAEALERWALKREKMLTLLDPRAARGARDVAKRCRILAAFRAAPLNGPEWDREWLAVREEALLLLSHNRHAEAGSIPPEQLDWGSSDRVTPVIDAPTSNETEGRAALAAWALRKAAVEVA